VKRVFVAFLMTLAMTLAHALPSPRDVEFQLQSGNYAAARAMVVEVLQAKPDSAQAHLLKAAILVDSDRNMSAARSELELVKTLDQNGKTVNSPLMNRLQSTVNAFYAERQIAQSKLQSVPQPVPQVVQPPVQHQVALANESSGIGFWVLILILVLAAGFALYRILRQHELERVVSGGRTTRKNDEVDDYLARSSYSAPSASSYTPPVPAPVPTPYVRTERHVVHHEHHYDNTGGAMSAGIGAAIGAGVGVLAAETLLHSDRHSAPAPYSPPYSPPVSTSVAPTYSSGSSSWDDERSSRTYDSGSSSWDNAPSPSSSSSSDSDSGSSDW